MKDYVADYEADLLLQGRVELTLETRIAELRRTGREAREAGDGQRAEDAWALFE